MKVYLVSFIINEIMPYIKLFKLWMTRPIFNAIN